MGRGNEVARYNPQEFIVRKRKSRFPRKLGALMLVGAAVAVAGTGAWASVDDGPEQGNCTDVNNQLIDVNTHGFKNNVRGVLDLVGRRNDERTITGVAEALTEDRGYYISPERLAGANAKAKFIVRDSDGTLQDRLPDGQFCAVVPSYIPNGVVEIREADETLTTVADEQDLDVAYLRKLNPQRALSAKKNTDVLPIGTTVRVDDEIDPSFVYREIDEKEKNINGMGDANMRARILMANIALMGAGQTPIKPGDEGYFPLKGGTDSKGKAHGAAEIIATYGNTFTPIDVGDSQIGGKDKKPKIPNPGLPKVNPGKPKTPEKPVQPHNKLLEMGPIVSHTVTGDPIPSTISGYKYWNQHDKRWGKQRYEYPGGHGHTIITSGCGPSSNATVISNLAGTKTNPSIEAKWAKRKGFRVEGGTDHDAFTERPQSVGLQAKHIPRTLEAVRSITDKGGMVILNGEDERPSTPATGSGHIYVVYKVTEGGRFLILDPNSVTKSLKTWSAGTILGVASDAVGVWKK